MPHAIRRVDIAGRDVTEQLQLLLRKAGYHLHTSSEKEVVRIIKEKTGYVAFNPVKEEKDASTVRPEDFKLPDGNIVRVRLHRHQLGEADSDDHLHSWAPNASAPRRSSSTRSS